METYSSAIVSVPTQQIANFLWYIEKNIYFKKHKTILYLIIFGFS